MDGVFAAQGANQDKIVQLILCDARRDPIALIHLLGHDEIYKVH